MYYAVRSGDLVRPKNCKRCGSNKHKIHGHHSDYDKPLDVIWLCPKCHIAEHKRLREGEVYDCE